MRNIMYTSMAFSSIDQKKQEMFFSNTDMPKLLTDNAVKIESSITEGEKRKAVSLMKTVKSLGYDGFPAEFYKEYIVYSCSSSAEGISGGF